MQRVFVIRRKNLLRFSKVASRGGDEEKKTFRSESAMWEKLVDLFFF